MESFYTEKGVHRTSLPKHQEYITNNTSQQLALTYVLLQLSCLPVHPWKRYAEQHTEQVQSQVIKAGGFVFLAGQVPADNNANPTEGTIAEKTHKMCQNTQAVLETAGSSLDKVVKVTVRVVLCWMSKSTHS